MRIAYVGPFAYPSSNANSLRVHGMVCALHAAGHEVSVCSGFRDVDLRPHAESDQSPVTWCAEEYASGTMSFAPAGWRGLFLGDRTLRWLRSRGPSIDVIVLYGTHFGYLSRLLPYCRRSDIRLYLDIVEWYDPRHLPGGLLGPYAIANELSMRVLAPLADGLFVISRYLETYFRGRGAWVLRVPPIFSEVRPRLTQPRRIGSKLSLCYVGAPGKKDDLGNVLIGVERAVRAGVDVELHVVGVSEIESERQERKDGASARKTHAWAKFYGRVPNEEALKIVSACDFSVLLRGDFRYTRAGFPSKVVESLCVGTPVMANLTSDLGDYLVDGLNSLIVAAPTPQGLSESIQRAAKMSVADLSAFRAAAVSTANASFRPRLYSAEMTRFLRGPK